MIAQRIGDESRSIIGVLSGTLPGAEGKLEGYARWVIRDAIDLHLTPPEASESAEWFQREANREVILAGTFFDLATAFQLDWGRRLAYTAVYRRDDELRRPFRVKEYAKKFVGILPSGLLNVFYLSCLERGVEETVKVFEWPKGEAASNNFFGEPKYFFLEPVQLQRLGVQITTRPMPEVVTPRAVVVGVDEPALGFSVSVLSEKLREAMGLPAGVGGVVIESVVEGSPAHIAGFRGCDRKAIRGSEELPVGGDLLVEADGRVIGSIEEFCE